MRLWRIHPKYLDQKGLCGLWREALQAQRILKELREGKTKIPYENHPQFLQFKRFAPWNQMIMMGDYLFPIWEEGIRRGYRFDRQKIIGLPLGLPLMKATVTKGQISFESKLIKEKVLNRAPNWWRTEWEKALLDPHPLFEMTNDGNLMCEKQ